MTATPAPYTLTLTSGERQAIDWIGHRYAHGNELYFALCKCDWEPEECDWDSPDPIVFHVPEHVAWAIRDIAEESEHRWDCFAEELVTKLEQFLDRVV